MGILSEVVEPHCI